jgi:hypothetical protein
MKLRLGRGGGSGALVSPVVLPDAARCGSKEALFLLLFLLLFSNVVQNSSLSDIIDDVSSTSLASACGTCK